jgi:hypothetical protein
MKDPQIAQPRKFPGLNYTDYSSGSDRIQLQASLLRKESRVLAF